VLSDIGSCEVNVYDNESCKPMDISEYVYKKRVMQSGLGSQSFIVECCRLATSMAKQQIPRVLLCLMSCACRGVARYNFDNLNIERGHPARDPSDTFIYIKI
jgi:hypothetical protein